MAFPPRGKKNRRSSSTTALENQAPQKKAAQPNPPRLAITGDCSRDAIEEAAKSIGIITDKNVTHLIVADECPKRTLKLLNALARGNWVVHPNWLHDSLAHKKLLPEEHYEMHNEIPGAKRARLAAQDRANRGAHGAGTLDSFFIQLGKDTTIPCEKLSELLTAAGATVTTTSDDDLNTRVYHSGKLLGHLLETDLLDSIMAVNPPALEPNDKQLVGALVDQVVLEDQVALEDEQPAVLEDQPLAFEESKPPKRPRATAPVVLPKAAPRALGDGLELQIWKPANNSSSRFFGLDEALKIYRQRLPKCNVRMNGVGDFLANLVDNDKSYTATLERNGITLAACTWVPHVGFAEVLLLAVKRGFSRKQLGSRLLSHVESHLGASKVVSVAVCAGLDCVGFWGKMGYGAETALEVVHWSQLLDPFGSSRVLIKRLRSVRLCAHVSEANAPKSR